MSLSLSHTHTLSLSLSFSLLLPPYFSSSLSPPTYQNCAFLSYVVRHDPPPDVFLKINLSVLKSVGRQEYDKKDWGGWIPLHYALRWTSFPEVASIFLASTSRQYLTLACTVYGRTPLDYLNDVRLDEAPNTAEIRVRVSDALADHAGFREKHEPRGAALSLLGLATTSSSSGDNERTGRQGVQYYASRIEADPNCLLKRDKATGYRLLERARASDETEEVRKFVEEKTDIAMAVKESFPDSSDEEFKTRFGMWNDL